MICTIDIQHFPVATLCLPVATFHLLLVGTILLSFFFHGSPDSWLLLRGLGLLSYGLEGGYLFSFLLNLLLYFVLIFSGTFLLFQSLFFFSTLFFFFEAIPDCLFKFIKYFLSMSTKFVHVFSRFVQGNPAGNYQFQIT